MKIGIAFVVGIVFAGVEGVVFVVVGIVFAVVGSDVDCITFDVGIFFVVEIILVVEKSGFVDVDVGATVDVDAGVIDVTIGIDVLITLGAIISVTELSSESVESMVETSIK